MGAMTIRNLSEETHRAIKLRAKQKGRSAEAEVRAILDEAVTLPVRRRLGTELEKFGKLLGGVELNIRRDKTPMRSASFE